MVKWSMFNSATNFGYIKGSFVLPFFKEEFEI